MLYVSLAEIETLKAAKSTDAAAWTAAQTRLAEAARLGPDMPLILRAYFESFRAQGKLPPEAAQNMLFKALDLIPQDEEVRYLLASDFEARGMLEDAIDVIRIAAYSAPDKDPANAKEKDKQDKRRAKCRLGGETLHETPREMLARLNAKAKAAGLPDRDPGQPTPPG